MHASRGSGALFGSQTAEERLRLVRRLPACGLRPGLGARLLAPAPCSEEVSLRLRILGVLVQASFSMR